MLEELNEWRVTNVNGIEISECAVLLNRTCRHPHHNPLEFHVPRDSCYLSLGTDSIVDWYPKQR